MTNDHNSHSGRNGLILTGGGARAAYQVGVLKGLAEILPQDMKTPFPVITGTSAGAINAAVLASHGDDFQRGVRRLVKVWGEFETSMIYRADWGALFGALGWLFRLVFGGSGKRKPRALLNNSPLRELLLKKVWFEGIDQAIADGHLHGVGISVSGYTSARCITVCRAKDANFEPWTRSRREGRMGDITVDHLMASSAMPFIFPAVKIDREYCGDGVMRQSAPLSSAIHLGADRLLVLGLRNEDPNELPAPGQRVHYPAFGHVAGYLLDTLFMDSLYTDLERLRRINQVLARLNTDEQQENIRLRHVDCEIIVPSADIRNFAQAHAKSLPRPIKLLLSGLGGMNSGGRQLLSYLLFESGYTQDLIELGYRDALQRRDELRAYLLGR